MYQDPSSGQWLNDDGSPMFSYLPLGYGDYTNPAMQPGTDNTPAEPAPTGAPGPADPAAGDDGGYHPGPLPPFVLPPRRDLPGLPGVTPAPQFNFRAPSVEEALADPGYKFVVGQGTDALQRWAASKGTLNDSPTGEALINYGQNAASQQYKSVWDRMFSVAREAYAPQLQQWSAETGRDALGYTTETGWKQHANDMDYKTAYDKWQAQIDWDKWNAEHAAK